MFTDIIPPEISNLVEAYFPSIIGGTLVIAVAWIFAFFLEKAMNNFIRNHTSLEASLITQLVKLLRYTILLLTFVIVLDEFGVDIASLIAALGIFGFALAIGLRTTTTNFFTGVMLSILKPYEVGDYIEGERVEGVVESIHKFYTVVVGKDGVYTAVPNSAMWARSVRNFSRPRPRCVELDITVKSGLTMNALKTLVLDALQGESGIAADMKPLVRLIDVQNSSITVRNSFWCNAEDEPAVRGRMTDTLRQKIAAGGGVAEKCLLPPCAPLGHVMGHIGHDDPCHPGHAGTLPSIGASGYN